MNPSNALFALALLLSLGGTVGAATSDDSLVDSRGFIDVWRLRSDTADVEAVLVTQDIDVTCPDYEGGEDEALTERQLARQARERQACEEAFARAKTRSDAAQSAYNQRWRPALFAALRQGDPIAEVVLRQCATTPALDRSGIESTCDEDAGRRAVAAVRLKAIGFAPAFDAATESPPLPLQDPRERAVAQEHALAMMRQGHFGMNRQDSYHGGNAPATAEELQDIRRWLLIDAALSEVRRAFTFSIGPEWHTSELAVPRLNRRPLTPGYLTWGRALHYGGGNSPYSGPHDWMDGGRKTFLHFANRRRLVLGGADDPHFMRQLHDLLAASEAAIDARLRADPRWAVFLVSRQGRHEWVPAGSRSTSGQLASEWTGSWTLQKTFYDFTPEPSAPAHAPRWATVSRDDDRSWIDYATATGYYRCELRYSGGSTYRLPDGQHGSSATDTVLGYLPAVSRDFYAGEPAPVDALAPLDPRKRYRQVLVQCPEGEAEDNRSVRFLLLAGDTLLEIHRDAAHGPLVQMRHYTRGGPLVEAAPFTETDPRAYLARLDQLARKAEAARDAIESASVAELIASLRTSRNESLYYDSEGWPSNVKALNQRPGTVPELVAALRTETDGLVRFNLAMLLARKLSTGKLAPEDAIVAGDGLALALADAHPWVRTEAVWGLRFTRARRYIEPARALLADPDAQVRAEASGTVRALSRDDAPAGNR